jgi:16S rRNA U516 pseudouridylate synthase RsuA-like enzyme
LDRALSKLGLASRAEARGLIADGAVTVGGRVVRDAARLVDLQSAKIAVEGRRPQAAAWRTIALHKPRGVVTTRRDPEGRKTVFDLLGDDGRGLVAVGHEVTRLLRVSFGGIELGALQPGRFREISRDDIDRIGSMFKYKT